MLLNRENQACHRVDLQVHHDTTCVHAFVYLEVMTQPWHSLSLVILLILNNHAYQLFKSVVGWCEQLRTTACTGVLIKSLKDSIIGH